MARSNKDFSCNTSFLDMLFNMLLAFVAMFVLAFALMAVQQKKQADPGVKPHAEFVIEMSWDKNIKDDMDLWVEDPEGNVVFFRRREAGLMNLDRDDRGQINDVINTPTGQIEFSENREVVTIRGIVAGEYVVNVHAYRLEQGSLDVSVRVDKINPFSTVAARTVTVTRCGEEITFTRFTVNKEGVVTSTNTLPKSLLQADRPQLP